MSMESSNLENNTDTKKDSDKNIQSSGTSRLRAKYNHIKFTLGGNSDQSKFANSEIGKKAALKLAEMRKRYGLPPIESKVPVETPDSETSQIRALGSKNKKVIYDVKHEMKEMEPLLRGLIKQANENPNKFDTPKFYNKAREILKIRHEASAYLESGAIDCNPAEFLKRLKQAHTDLMKYAKAAEDIKGKNREEITKKEVDEPEIIDLDNCLDNTRNGVEQPIAADLETARKGFAAFQAQCDKDDKEWQKLLISETAVGRGIRAMYLGLKPMLYADDLTTKEFETVKGLFTKHAKEDFKIIGQVIMSESSVEKVLTAFPQYFPDYFPGSSAHSYISKLEQEWQKPQKKYGLIPTRKSYKKEYFIQNGLLFGYPLNAVKQFANYNNAIEELGKAFLSEKTSSADKQTLYGYLHGSKPLLDSQVGQEERKQARKHFINTHQQDILALIDKKLPYLKDDKKGKQYLLSREGVQLPGFQYTSGIKDESEKAFEEKVQAIYKQSGIEDYIENLKTKNQ